MQKRDAGPVPGLGRSPGGGNGNLLQYSCLENPTDREAWRTTVQGLKEMGMTEATQHAHKNQKNGFPFCFLLSQKPIILHSLDAKTLESSKLESHWTVLYFKLSFVSHLFVEKLLCPSSAMHWTFSQCQSFVINTSSSCFQGQFCKKKFK